MVYDYDTDPSDLPDEDMQDRAYTEFRLDKVEEDNLKDIENTVAKKNVNSGNRDFMLNYLNGLLRKVQRVKEEERKYEGDDNDNVNEYLSRISKLIMQVKAFK